MRPPSLLHSSELACTFNLSQQPRISPSALALSLRASDEGPELLNGNIVRAQSNLVKLHALDGLMYEVSELQRREWSENVPDRYL